MRESVFVAVEELPAAGDRGVTGAGGGMAAGFPVSMDERTELKKLIVKIFQTNGYESKRWERRTFVHRRWLVRRCSFMTSARARQPFMADQSVGQPVLLDGEVTLSVEPSTVQDRHWSGKWRVQSLVPENNQDLTIAPARAEGEDRSEGGGRKRITTTAQ